MSDDNKESKSVPKNEATQEEDSSPSHEARGTSDSSGNDKNPPTEEGSSGGLGESVEVIRRYLAEKLGFYPEETPAEDEPAKILHENTLQGVAKYIKDGKAKKIVVMAGAGISTSAGIPDFRSPGSGLYHNLEKYDLPDPQAIFDIDFFRKNPQPFFTLARELFPGSFNPTPSHYFIRLLQDKGLLLRHYTQNIDTLERVAGIDGEKLVEAHGTFHTSHCLNPDCRKEYSLEWMKERIFSDVDAVPKCEVCHTDVKPDIVFFGENLPNRFFSLVQDDFRKCDLLLILGTSLVVQPFASLVDKVPATCPRLLINREKAGQADPLMRLLGMGSGLDFDSSKNTKDVAWLGDCDDGCTQLAEALGYGDELKKLLAEEGATFGLKKKEEEKKLETKEATVETKEAKVEAKADSNVKDAAIAETTSSSGTSSL